MGHWEGTPGWQGWGGPGPGCPEQLWLPLVSPQLSGVGEFGAPWGSGRCSCPWQGWHWIGFDVPSKPFWNSGMIHCPFNLGMLRGILPWIGLCRDTSGQGFYSQNAPEICWLWNSSAGTLQEELGDLGSSSLEKAARGDLNLGCQ